MLVAVTVLNLITAIATINFVIAQGFQEVYANFNH
jgi:hypothetical protein